MFILNIMFWVILKSNENGTGHRRYLAYLSDSGKFSVLCHLFSDMQRYFCAALDGLISGTSTVYMVKPGFIRCLLLLEVCRGSPEWFHIQPKHSLKEEFENVGHYHFYFVLLISSPSDLFSVQKNPRWSWIIFHRTSLSKTKLFVNSLCNLVRFSQQMACAKCKFINLCCENVFIVYMSRCRDDGGCQHA